jgi:hypothetical protein
MRSFNPSPSRLEELLVSLPRKTDERKLLQLAVEERPLRMFPVYYNDVNKGDYIFLKFALHCKLITNFFSGFVLHVKAYMFQVMSQNMFLIFKFGHEKCLHFYFSYGLLAT